MPIINDDSFINLQDDVQDIEKILYQLAMVHKLAYEILNGQYHKNKFPVMISEELLYNIDAILNEDENNFNEFARSSVGAWLGKQLC